jgi:hypothetical protein
MNQTERIQPKETLTPKEISGDTQRPTKDDASLSGLSERVEMLSVLEPKLSPIMREALRIKLGHEQREMEEVAERKDEAERADARKQGALDAQFFRRRRLSEGSW